MKDRCILCSDYAVKKDKRAIYESENARNIQLCEKHDRALTYFAIDNKIYKDTNTGFIFGANGYSWRDDPVKKQMEDELFDAIKSIANDYKSCMLPIETYLLEYPQDSFDGFIPKHCKYVFPERIGFLFSHKYGHLFGLDNKPSFTTDKPIMLDSNYDPILSEFSWESNDKLISYTISDEDIDSWLCIQITNMAKMKEKRGYIPNRCLAINLNGKQCQGWQCNKNIHLCESHQLGKKKIYGVRSLPDGKTVDFELESVQKYIRILKEKKNVQP